MAEAGKEAMAELAESKPTAVAAAGHYRWVICSLPCFAATVNYLDRQVISLLKPTLQSEG